MSRGYSVGLSIGSMIFLLIYLVLSSLYVAVNFFFFFFLFIFPPWNHYNSQRNFICCVIYRINNQCVFAFLNKDFPWLLQWRNRSSNLKLFVYHIMFLAFILYYWSYVINIHIHNPIILWYLIYYKRKRKLLKCDIQFWYAKLQFLFIFD